MAESAKQTSGVITNLLNGTVSSLRTVVPLELEIMQPKLLGKNFRMHYGVFIGITGDFEGKLIMAGNQTIFGVLGEEMFGMPLQDEMLQSFSGELGNMVAGGLSTSVFNDGIDINITAPTIMSGDTTLTGYKEGIEVPIRMDEAGNMDIFLLMD